MWAKLHLQFRLLNFPTNPQRLLLSFRIQFHVVKYERVITPLAVEGIRFHL